LIAPACAQSPANEKSKCRSRNSRTPLVVGCSDTLPVTCSILHVDDLTKGTAPPASGDLNSPTRLSSWR